MNNPLDDHVEAYTRKSVYDFDNEIILNWYPKKILKYCKSRKSLLELGLGHGCTADILGFNFEKYLIIEGSKNIINNFRKLYPNSKVEIYESIFEKFDTAFKFDVILMGFVLEHVNDPNFILKHYKKFLSDNGKIFITVPNAESMNRRLGYYAGLLEDMHKLSDNDYKQGHKRYYSVETIKKEVVNAGYKIDRIEGLFLKPFTTNQLLSLKLDPRIIESLCLLGTNYPELSLGILLEVSKA
jgi:2-polyprenyl-3-methyl-5-hydroxy-6-metoxy-1,4-benzoquinol methylase